jgi:hypothetical protein
LNTPLVAVEGIAVSDVARPAWREMLALLRLATFLRVDGRDIQGRGSTLAMLAGAWLAAWIIADPLLHSRELVFSWYAIPDVVCIGAAVFALAWLLGRVARPVIEFRRTLVLALAALPLAMLGEVASWKLVASHQQMLVVALSVYALAFFARGLHALSGRHQPLALVAGALVTALLVMSLDRVQANPRLWVRAEDKLDRFSAAGADWARMARMQFAQQARIDADVAKLAPQNPSATDVYFLGFAGYGQQQVFAREIDLAGQVVGGRYGSGERSLRLVNDQTDLASWPLASEPALGHALRRLGAVMGDEDVLFLVLSSHGDRDAGVRVSNPGTVTTQLAPSTLNEMLRDAGVEWRVIVVSACYSGSFVDALADERTVVITAAARDRKSFGCNDSRFLTYFGEAFFRDALGGAASLRAAFETARAALEKKERASGIVPSQPQAHFGSEVEARLAGIEAGARSAQGR